METAKSCFYQRWKQYLDSKKLYINSPTNKNLKEHQAPIQNLQGRSIKIHVGPPKTGTSAIQSWLFSNREKLKNEGIYYPEHSCDENGVSSGNYEKLISFDKKQSKGYFDDNKARKLLAQFQKTNCDTLLLSSEHFYYYLIWLFSRFQQAEFIFYIRHPLSIAESGFHQEVKRHQRTLAFSIPDSISFSNLKIVQSLADEFDCKITYRYYDEHLFEGGSLIADFARLINTKIQVSDGIKRLNTQYSPGAITLMMTCNKFASDALRRELDIFLQRYSEKYPPFSFISDEKSKEITSIFIAEASKLANSNPSIEPQKIRALVNNYQKPSACSAKEFEQDLQQILYEISNDSPNLAMKLYQEILKSGEFSKYVDLAQNIEIKWYQKLWLKVFR